MIKPALTIGLILLACLSSCRASGIDFSKQNLSAQDLNQLANCIYKVEGGAKTKYPYGVMSVKTPNLRQVCINTIRNNFQRWNHNNSISFIDYLGNIYCPKRSDFQGNINWRKNIKKILKNN